MPIHIHIKLKKIIFSYFFIISFHQILMRNLNLQMKIQSKVSRRSTNWIQESKSLTLKAHDDEAVNCYWACPSFNTLLVSPIVDWIDFPVHSYLWRLVTAMTVPRKRFYWKVVTIEEYNYMKKNYEICYNITYTYNR